jgi:hypothetical protein
VPGPSRVVPRRTVSPSRSKSGNCLQHRPGVDKAPGGARLAEAELQELHNDIAVYSFAKSYVCWLA